MTKKSSQVGRAAIKRAAPIAVIVATSLLAACAGNQSPSSAARAIPAKPSSDSADRQALAPNLKKAPAGESQAGNNESSKPAPEVAPREPRFAPALLVGLNRGGVATLLGEPTLLRRDPPAEIWQYAKKDCVLLVFLYEDSPEKFRVRHVELRRRTGPEPANLNREMRRTCLLRFDGPGLQQQRKSGKS